MTKRNRPLRPGWLGIFCLLLTLACALPANLTSQPEAPSAPTVQPVPTLPAQLRDERPLAGEPLPLESLPLSPNSSFAPTYQPRVVQPLTDGPRGVVPLDNLVNGAILEPLGESERSQLAADGFVRLGQPVESLLAFYRQAAEQNLPTYLGRDQVIQAAGAVQQAAWAQARAEYLPNRLLEMSRTLLAGAEAQLAEIEALDSTLQAETAYAQLREAAVRNAAYFGVATRLLDPETPLSPTVEGVVESELSLLRSGGNQLISPILGRVFDYSALRTAPAGVERALSWYRLHPFELSGESGQARLQGLRWLLLAELLEQPASAAAWNGVYQPLAFFEGAQAGVSSDLFFALAQVTGRQAVDLFALTLLRQPDPRFYLLPPARSPAGAILPALTYNQVGGWEGSGLPPATAEQTAVGLVRQRGRPLDVAASFGAQLALSELSALGENAFSGYDAQLAQQQGVYANWSEAEWTASWGFGWLYALQPLLVLPPEGAPAYMASDVWQAGTLASWQTGFAYSLAVRQPPMPSGAGELGQVGAPVYLEPQAALYARIAAHVRQQLDGLAGFGFLSQPTADRLRQLEGDLLFLVEAIALQEAGYGLPAGVGEVNGRLLSQVPVQNAVSEDPRLYLPPTQLRQQLLLVWIAGEPYAVVGWVLDADG